MSKSKYKIGDKVWVQGTVTDGASGEVEVKFRNAHGINESGACFVMVTPKQLKPDVTFKWSPAKAKKKGSKK